MSIKQWIQKNNLLADLVAHLRTPLYRNGYALMMSTAATSGLGAIYWVIAARAYKPDLVGQYSAAVAAMLFLAGAAGLFLDGAMVRFIPRAGKATPRLIGMAYLISALAAALIASVFLIGIKVWAPALAFLTEDPWLTAGFILGTVVTVIFAEEDGALTGLRQATWVPLENSIYSVLKIAVLIGLALTAAPIWHPGLLDRTRHSPDRGSKPAYLYAPGASPHPKNRPKRRAAGGGPDYPLHCR